MRSFTRNLFSIVGHLTKRHDVIVYLETENDWHHVGPFVEKLLENTQAKVCFVCSEPVSFEPEIIIRFQGRASFHIIGSGILRSFLFPQLSATLFIMTLTDLGKPQLRKSKNVANYVYIFHSVTSTHMCYPATAFDEYDTIFCVGPHQKNEIRKRERLYDLTQKRLVDFGHASIEKMRAFATTSYSPPNPKRIAIAPSWGPGSLIETLPAEFYLNLLQAGFSLYVRLHSMSINRKHLFKADIESIARSNPNMDLDYNHLDMHSLKNCSTMISDWSGAATEYAFGFCRPVIFVDTKRKVRNKDYEKLQLTPLEVAIRDKIGKIVSVDEAIGLAEWLPALLDEENLVNMAKIIEEHYRKNIFMETPSWENGLNALQEIHGDVFGHDPTSAPHANEANNISDQY